MQANCGFRPIGSIFLGLLVGMTGAWAADSIPGQPPTDPNPLNLEAHGFVSFGHLQTWGNNWLGETRSGSNEFWEAAANAIARPMDRVRIGAQLFARDLGEYDNGKAQVDWAYVDWRARDEIGIQVGRVKLPIGLYNESLDVDAARASVFLPPSIYALRSRDLYISTDGAKVYGIKGPLEYAVYGGHKEFDTNGGFATFFRQSGLGSQIDRLEVQWIAGGMVHWETPCPGLGVRLSLADAHGFTVAGSSPSGVIVESTVDDYYIGIISLIYDLDQTTFTAEYLRLRGRGETTIAPLGQTMPLVDDTEGIVLNATWHARPWLEWYVAGEGAFTQPGDRNGADHCYTAVAAVNVMPLPHWSIKAEFRDVHGTMGATAFDNPQGVEKHWQVLALKTTVDF